MIKPIYYNCTKWEDWQNGMYRMCKRDNDNNLVLLSKALLSDPSKLYCAMSDVVKGWPICTEEKLTKVDTNRRAWLGWAACSFNHKAPDFVTRKAWVMLSDVEQKRANLIAEKVIFEWESYYKKEELVCQLSLWE